MKIVIPLISTYLLLLISNQAIAQNNNYNKLVYHVKGDLNRDNIDDVVTVKEDTTDIHHPFLLEIKFRRKDGKDVTVLKSKIAVMENFPNGENTSACVLENLKIVKGILIFQNQMIRGNMTHKFRFQNNNFELIGYTYHYASPGNITFTDYNLLTGKKIDRKIEYETDKISEEKISVVKISPLPDLKNFRPFDFMY
ncbi:hypothetical protein [Pedobacter punctiformis]|uniref:Uncharacterized protein n=1 Tax=Pedobacter punctiformis TaxID=3004097 RepID=A0ABT4L8V5_9SPHI|nr:hypothetical protein [Pedobacter sp. HCMS5-2]MCZ4244286.1 hypothetical protein [Pedobacter sp. HCMS5-2]